MGKYTFIAEYKGGTYFSQYCAEDLHSALIDWCGGLPRKYFTISLQKNVESEILSVPRVKPVAIKGIQNT